MKDQALQWSGGEWHMLYSDMTATKAAPHVHFAVAVSSSPDLRHWTAPRIIAENAASPDIVRSPSGTFIVTYQTPQGLAYRTSSAASLRSWSDAHPLGRGLAHRMIDGALAFTGNGVILGFKAGTTTQHFEIAWAPSLSGTFRLVGRPDIVLYNDTVENYEFLTVDGAWHLVATSNTLDQPFLFTLGPGDPASPSTWLHWSAGRQLLVPSQSFNSGQGISSVAYEHANSAFLCVGPQGRGLPHVCRQHGADAVRGMGSRPHRTGPEQRSACTGRCRRAEGTPQWSRAEDQSDTGRPGRRVPQVPGGEEPLRDVTDH